MSNHQSWVPFPCHWSPTGWAQSTEDGNACTCVPCSEPIASAADMRERAAKWCENEHEIAREEANEDGDYGAGFLHGLKYAAEGLRALPLNSDNDEPRDAVREIDGPDGWSDPDEGAR